MDNVLEMIISVARAGGWLALAGGEWWLPVRMVIIGTGLLVTLTARDAIRATHQHDTALLIEQLAAASRPQAASLEPRLHQARAR